MKRRASVILTDSYVAAAEVQPQRGEWRSGSLHRVRVAVPRVLDDVDIAPIADAVIQALQGADLLGLPADLIIPSGWCFMCRLSELGKRFSESVAAFQLEEFLPVRLEDVTPVFLRRGRGAAWGIAVRTAPIRQLLERLEARGACIEHVRIDLCNALAATEEGVDGRLGVGLKDHSRAGFVIRSGRGCLPDVIRTVFNAPEAVNGEFIRCHVDLTESHLGAGTDRWVWCDLRAPPADGPANEDSDEESDARGDPEDRLTVPELLAAPAKHPEQPDLRCGQLAAGDRLQGVSRHAVRTMLLACLVLAALTVDLRIQRSSHARRVAEFTQRQTALYRQMFPDGDVPTSPAMRLASERRRLEGLTQRGQADPAGMGEAQPQVDRCAALKEIRAFVAALPGDVRLMLLELNVDGQQLSIRGRTADHRDAERIAEALRAVGGTDVRPPRTTRVKSGGVDFTIRASKNDGDEQ